MGNTFGLERLHSDAFAPQAGTNLGIIVTGELSRLSSEGIDGWGVEQRIGGSDNKFGYSVQKKIWNKVNRDFTSFFIKVGWMKKLESSEVDQYNYRAFPNEFIWELNEETPEGHLPLTNALRGTQLLSSIFTHPAFVEEGEEEKEEEKQGSISGEDKGSVKKGGLLGGLRSKLFGKPDYSF
uniref:Tetrapyrrole-binding protein, chloroplastic-like n=1 Tax=Nicotiana tabacum TaxID=4097 RepID=A0A1S4AF23_TOBAC|nr:PREDICTED: tetrapyrrole-binding protein, chloroplastic-like [Nicotiana tabacum]